MAVVKNLMVRAGADFSSMRKEMSKASKNLSDFKTSVSRTMKGIGLALATLGIGAAIKNAKDEAMGFEASLQQIERTMGGNAQAFTDWAKKGAGAFNLARTDAVKYGAVFSNLLSGFSKDTSETTKNTQELLKASAIVASSTGRTMADTLDRIRSGLLGNTESIEDLGINVNVAMIESTKAFQKFANGKPWQQLSFQTQQQIRLFAILEQAATKYGTELAQNTTSNEQKFIVQLKNAQLALGQAFLPIYNVVLPALTRMASALANVMNFIARFSEALFGSKKVQEQAKATTAQAGAVRGLGDAYEKAGKQAKGSVAGFDQVNLVGGTSGAAGVDSGGILPTETTQETGAINKVAEKMKEVTTKAQEMAAKVKAAFADMKTAIVQNKDAIIAALAGIAAGFTTYLLVSKWSAGVATLATNFKKLGIAIRAAWLALTGPIGLIVLGVGAIVAAFVYFYRTNEKFKGFVDGIFQKIGDVAKWLWQNVMVPFGQWLADVMPKAWGAVTTAATWLWKNVLVPVGDFMLWFWNNVMKPVGKALGGVLGVAFQTVADIAKSFWKNVLVPLGKALSEMFGPAVEAVSAVLTFLWENVMKPLGRYISNDMKPIWKGLADVIVFLLDNVLKPIVSYVGGSLKRTFNTVFEGIGEVIEGLKTIFIGLMDFITGVFTGDWEKAWEGIKKIFKGVFDSLHAIVKTPLNLIIDAINTLIRGLNKISFSVPDWDWLGNDIQGKSFGISIPNIPKLARGGLAFGPTLATVGDNRNASVDPEVIAPLSKLEAMMSGQDNREVVAVLKAILGAIKQSGNGDTLTMSKTALGRAAAAGLNDLSRRTGQKPITI